LEGYSEVNTIKNRRAVSPVIATVILVAVTIAVAVSVAYWMGGIAGQYTRFEKVAVQTSYSVKEATSGWKVTMELKNTGSADATLIRMFVNDVPVPYDATHYGVSAYVADSVSTDLPYASGMTLVSGQGNTIVLRISSTYGQLSSGTMLNIKVHSAGGMDYIALVQLV